MLIDTTRAPAVTELATAAVKINGNAPRHRSQTMELGA
jgi:hypothetical protein